MNGTRRNITRFAPLAAIGLCVALAGCAQKPPPVGGSTSSKAEKARKEAEALAMNSAIAAADAQAKAFPDLAKNRTMPISNIVIEPASKGAVPGTPVPSRPKGGASAPVPETVVAKGLPTAKSPQRPGTLIRERVVSTIPYLTEAEAEDDTLAQARDLVEQKLASLDPPIRHKPSIAEVKSDFVRKDSRTVRRPDPVEKETFARYGVNGNLVYVEYDVEVTAEQVRELRSQERVSAGMRLLGMLVAVSFAGFLFLRADEWTKGYLTRWLAFAAVLLAGGAAAVFLFV